MLRVSTRSSTPIGSSTQSTLPLVSSEQFTLYTRRGSGHGCSCTHVLGGDHSRGQDLSVEG